MFCPLSFVENSFLFFSNHFSPLFYFSQESFIVLKDDILVFIFIHFGMSKGLKITFNKK